MKKMLSLHQITQQQWKMRLCRLQANRKRRMFIKRKEPMQVF